MKRFVVAVVLLLGVLSVPTVALGCDNPEGWSSIQNDECNRGATTYTGPTNESLWNDSLGTYYRAGPIVVNDTVYVVAQNVTAYNATDGSIRWSESLTNRTDVTPTYYNGSIIVGGENTTLYSFDAETGTPEWNNSNFSGITTGGLVANGTYYVGTNVGMVAVYPENGTQKWEYTNMSVATGGPAFYNGIVYVGSDDSRVYAVNESGGYQWSNPTGGPASAPTVSDGVVYTGGGTNVIAWNASHGQYIWGTNVDADIESSIALLNNSLYLGTIDGTVYALDSQNGSELWNFTSPSQSIPKIQTSPVINNTTLYVASTGTATNPDTGNTEASYLYVMDPDDGTVKWNRPFDKQIQSGPVLYAGRVVIGELADSPSENRINVLGSPVDESEVPFKSQGSESTPTETPTPDVGPSGDSDNVTRTPIPVSGGSDGFGFSISNIFVIGGVLAAVALIGYVLIFYTRSSEEATYIE